eukprot:861342_1
MITSIILLWVISCVYGETIDRTADNSDPVSCVSFPCIINCKKRKSCYDTTISCPSTGEGDCTINLADDSPAELSTIDAGSSTNVTINVNSGSNEALYQSTINAGNINNLDITVGSAYRALREAEINIQTMSGNLEFNVNGNSYHAFYEGVLNVGGINGGVHLREHTSHATSANFAEMVLSITDDINGDVLVESTYDNKKQSFDGANFTIDGAVSGDVTFSSRSYASFSENLITISGDIS